MNWDVAFYMNADGDTPVADFLLTLSEKEYDKCKVYIEVMMTFGPLLPTQYAKHIDNGIWELRPEFGGTELRLFYFTYVKDLVVILHGCKKPNKQKEFRREYAIAERRMREITEP